MSTAQAESGALKTTRSAVKSKSRSWTKRLTAGVPEQAALGERPTSLYLSWSSVASWKPSNCRASTSTDLSFQPSISVSPECAPRKAGPTFGVGSRVKPRKRICEMCPQLTCPWCESAPNQRQGRFHERTPETACSRDPCEEIWR